MTYGTNTSQRATAASPSDRSVRELVSDLSALVPRLVRDELKLAQAETARKGKQAGLGAGMLGGSGLIALYGIACLLACAIAAISMKVHVWLAALIIGAALMAVAGVSALVGKNRLRKTRPPIPQRAISSMKADISELREKAHR